MKKNQKGKGQRPGIRLNANGIITRKTILKVAASLFAEKGYTGTSFRDITEISGIGLGSVVYHFGMKENLYLETVSCYLPSASKVQEIVKSLDTPCTKITRKEITSALSAMLFALLKEIHCNKKAGFTAQLYARIMLDATADVMALIKERMMPIETCFMSFAKRAVPSMSDTQLQAWRHFLAAQLMYSIFAKEYLMKEYSSDSTALKVMEHFAETTVATSVSLFVK